jgi:hypothetical protein
MLTGLVEGTKWSNYKGEEAQALLEESTLINAQNVFIGANINNQSKLLHDRINYDRKKFNATGSCTADHFIIFEP